ncbi:hypothetical protein BPNPMPFG_001244 [Mesorhizobium sp. AR07]|uniref:hypothetical protein n=1 Tax=Mesorhizobium sp. AR07 TaxID=2865838 RepID=UPI002160FC4B|nr:hypothetical protein [Mesorhizobium sp. AR07]UVK45685.1 hypothetical protein BPNPMPFG_001244 [Mesorhizobium sp. AR07]
MIAKFCQDRGLTFHLRSVQATWPDGKYENYRVHCFSDDAAARVFRDHFDGVKFDPKRDRENGNVKGVWRRTGEYRQILEMGPLSVPEILRN